MQISPLVPQDRAAWEVLARGYRDFYKTPTTDDEFSAAWERLMEARSMFGLAAKIDGEMVGIAHYLYHD
ncbi:MAG: GNAT family N-acetyltransferase, partial [Massilia sp.]